MNNRPPKYFTRLLAWFCHDDFYEELQGDLEERFYSNTQQYGQRKARTQYRLEVLKLIRPSVLGKVKIQTQNNNIAMFKNYTLVAFRNLSRNRLFSAINIFGLAMSMAVGLLAIAFATEIYSYDNFHEHKDRIYRVNNIVVKQTGELSVPYASTSLLAGQKIREQIPGIEKVASFYKGLYGDLKAENQTFNIQGYFASPEFFEVFTFPMIQGNPQTALVEPYSLVLTESSAIKMFNSTDVIGKTVERNDKPYTVTAVVQDPPKNSHLQFEILAAQSTLATLSNDYVLSNWSAMWSSYAYLLLDKTHNLEQIQAGLDEIAKVENANSKTLNANMRLESMSNIFPGEDRWNEVGTVMPIERVNAIVYLALIVIFSACFNYANLSIARSLKRAKEIGIRKVVGAKKNQVFVQFITEAIIVSFMALILAYFLFRLIKPEFISLNYYNSRTTTLDLSLGTYLYFIIFSIFIGFLSGAIPALVMTKFKPISIIKGISNMKVAGGVNIRKVLVGIQFALSIGFAVLVTLAYKQYQHALNFDLGYVTDSILNVELQGNDFELVKSAFEQVPEVSEISGSGFMPSTGSLNSSYAKVEGQIDSVTVYSIWVNEDYTGNLKHNFLAGEPINGSLEKKQMIVNEEFLKAFNLGSPEEAIGQKVDYYKDIREIVAVISNFHYGTIYDRVEPFAFLHGNDRLYYANLKLTTQDITTTMSKISAAWENLDPEHELQSSFFEEDIERVYQDLSTSLKTYGFLAIIAISISMLGLLGMSVYTAESKVKELTIRKVLGATFYNLIMLLSRNFLLVLALAATVAVPIALYIFRTTLQKDMQYAMEVGFWELANGTVLVLLISMLTIGSQASKAARTNPAENLRNE